MSKKVNTLYFSATGTTKKVVSKMGNEIAEKMDSIRVINSIDFTLSEVREKPLSYAEDDIVIVGVPVYAGRVPNVLLRYLNSIKGNGALAVAIVLYGNRNYDDALVELKDILEEDGFKVIAGAAFIGEHAFSKILAKNRPDEKDMDIIVDFADKIYNKLISNHDFETVAVKGNKPYRRYYMPKDKEGNPVDIRKVTPRTNENCKDCKACVSICPMASIDTVDVSKLNGICIKCGACIKNCPTNAKCFEDEGFINHKVELEIGFATRMEPEIFI